MSPVSDISNKFPFAKELSSSEQSILEQVGEKSEKLQKIFPEAHLQAATTDSSFSITNKCTVKKHATDGGEIKTSAEKLSLVSNSLKDRSVKNKIKSLEADRLKISFKTECGFSQDKKVSRSCLAFLEEKHLENVLETNEPFICIQKKVYDLFIGEENLKLADFSPAELQEVITLAHLFEFEINKLLVEIDRGDFLEGNIAILLKIVEQTNHEKLRAGCFQFIKEKSAIDLRMDDCGIIHATIFEFTDLEKIRKYLGFLCFSQITITMNPSKGQDIINLENFSKAFGDGVSSLDLTAMEEAIDDSVIEKLFINLTHINSLYIKNGKITDLTFKLLAKQTHLKILSFSWCMALTRADVSNFTDLTTLDLLGCHSIVAIEGLFDLKNLETLRLAYCRSLTAVDVSRLANLRVLNLAYSTALTQVDVKKLTNLTTLKLSWCAALTKVRLSHLPNLLSFRLRGCQALAEFTVSHLTHLTTLELIECPALKGVDVSGLTNLVTLELSECTALTAVDVSKLKKLATLIFAKSTALTEVDVSGLTNLELLDLFRCASVTAISGLRELENLNFMDLSECGALKVVEGLDRLTNLRDLHLEGCAAFKRRTLLETLELFMASE